MPTVRGVVFETFRTKAGFAAGAKLDNGRYVVLRSPDPFTALQVVEVEWPRPVDKATIKLATKERWKKKAERRRKRLARIAKNLESVARQS